MKKKVKIFFFIDCFRVGGMHRQVYLIIKNLNHSDYEPIIISQSQYGGYKDEFLSLECKKYNLKWKSRLSFFLILYRFIVILNKEKPDSIFITQAPNFIYFKIAKLFLPFQIKLIGSLRALNFWLGNKGKIYLFFENFLVRSFYNSCDFITTNSYALVSHYNSIIKVKKDKPILCIYNGIEFKTQIFTSTKNELFNTNTDDFIILMAARLDPMKDFDTLLKAAKIIYRKNESIKFFILGDGILKNKIKDLILKYNLEECVFLLGEVKNIKEYLRFADISLLSTFGEGSSNTILESMQYGIPCIATRVGGNLELLENNRGILVNIKDEHSLANSVLLLLYDVNLRKVLINNAKHHIDNNFSITQMVKKYEEIFSISFDNSHLNFTN